MCCMRAFYTASDVAVDCERAEARDHPRAGTVPIPGTSSGGAVKNNRADAIIQCSGGVFGYSSYERHSRTTLLI